MVFKRRATSSLDDARGDNSGGCLPSHARHDESRNGPLLRRPSGRNYPPLPIRRCLFICSEATHVYTMYTCVWVYSVHVKRIYIYMYIVCNLVPLYCRRYGWRRRRGGRVEGRVFCASPAALGGRRPTVGPAGGHG